MAARSLDLCPTCGTLQDVPAVPTGAAAHCARCERRLPRPEDAPDGTLCFAAALAALVLYPAAMSLPVLSIERFGHRADASIWSGSVGLLAAGELFVGLVVLVCSVLLPLAKILSLLALTGLGPRLARHHRVRTLRLVELAGRWGMLDVLLIALLVAWLKLGDLVRVTPGPGAVAFTACVLLSLAAAAAFDARALWHAMPLGRGDGAEAVR